LLCRCEKRCAKATFYWQSKVNGGNASAGSWHGASFHATFLAGKILGVMMRKAAVLGALALMISAPAFAQGDGYYIEGTGALELGTDVELAGIDVDTESGYRISGAIGRSLPDGLAFELEATYGERDLDGVPVTVSGFGLMGNAFLEFDVQGPFGGYVGGGIGVVNVEVDFIGITDDDWVFGYQFMAGGTIQAADNVEVFGEYRYLGASDADIGGSDVGYSSHSIGAGVRFGF